MADMGVTTYTPNRGVEKEVSEFDGEVNFRSGLHKVDAETPCGFHGMRASAILTNSDGEVSEGEGSYFIEYEQACVDWVMIEMSETAEIMIDGTKHNPISTTVDGEVDETTAGVDEWAILQMNRGLFDKIASADEVKFRIAGVEILSFPSKLQQDMNQIAKEVDKNNTTQ